jgi:hypothetical protein
MTSARANRKPRRASLVQANRAARNYPRLPQMRPSHSHINSQLPRSFREDFRDDLALLDRGWGRPAQQISGQLGSVSISATLGRMSEKGSTAAGRVWAAWVRYRRTSPVAGRPAEGLPTEPRAVARPGARELVFMPHTGRSFDLE